MHRTRWIKYTRKRNCTPNCETNIIYKHTSLTKKIPDSRQNAYRYGITTQVCTYMRAALCGGNFPMRKGTPEIAKKLPTRKTNTRGRIRNKGGAGSDGREVYPSPAPASPADWCRLLLNVCALPLIQLQLVYPSCSKHISGPQNHTSRLLHCVLYGGPPVHPRGPHISFNG